MASLRFADSRQLGMLLARRFPGGIAHKAEGTRKYPAQPLHTLNRRLRALFHHGFLSRPAAQKELWQPGEGSSPVVYALAARGAHALSLRTASQAPNWAYERRDTAAPYLRHQLMITDVYSAVHIACELCEPGRFRLVSWATGDECRGTDPGRRELLFRADAACTICDLFEGCEWDFFLEIDAATMSGPRFLEKARGCWQYLSRRLHSAPGFRVLITAPTWERVAFLRDVCCHADDDERGSNLFWLTCLAELRRDPRRFFDPIWVTPAADRARALHEDPDEPED